MKWTDKGVRSVEDVQATGGEYPPGIPQVGVREEADMPFEADSTTKEQRHPREDSVALIGLNQSDPLLRSISAGHVVFCEECARDGAQAKTLLNGSQRIEIANRFSQILGETGFERLVFVAGFPAVASQEAKIVQHVAQECRNAQVMAVCRCDAKDIETALHSIASARQGRLLLLCPMTPTTSQVFYGQDPASLLERAAQLVASVRRDFPHVFVDIALVDAPRAEVSWLEESAIRLRAAGASAMLLCDTVGLATPREIRSLVQTLVQRAPNLAWGVHIHNDLGLATACTLEAIAAGALFVASSWMGLAERVGMTATEQLLVNLAIEPERRNSRFGISAAVWPEAPDLRGLPGLVQDLSGWVDVPLTVTDPVVGSGVHTLSTGLPSRQPEHFRPFDHESVLGLPATIVVTHLASASLLSKLVADRGFELDRTQTRELTRRVKAHCYAHRQAVVPEDVFRQMIADVINRPSPVVQTAPRVRVIHLSDPGALDAIIDETRRRPVVCQLSSVFGLVARGNRAGAAMLNTYKRRLRGKTYGSLVGGEEGFDALTHGLPHELRARLKSVEGCFFRLRVASQAIQTPAVRDGTHQLIILPSPYRDIFRALEADTEPETDLFAGCSYSAPLASSWNLSGSPDGSITDVDRALELARERGLGLIVLGRSTGCGSYPIVEVGEHGIRIRRDGPGLMAAVEAIGLPRVSATWPSFAARPVALPASREMTHVP
jgi:2-isopropylmalate synthase